MLARQRGALAGHRLKYRFHYTQRDYAVQIAKEQLYVVSERTNGRLGTGFFTTTIPPESLQGVSGESTRTPSIQSAVLWDGALIDLTEYLIGVCLRHDGIWTYSEGLLILP